MLPGPVVKLTSLPFPFPCPSPVLLLRLGCMTSLIGIRAIVEGVSGGTGEPEGEKNVSKYSRKAWAWVFLFCGIWSKGGGEAVREKDDTKSRERVVVS
jgi:hypothetical protein